MKPFPPHLTSTMSHCVLFLLGLQLSLLCAPAMAKAGPCKGCVAVFYAGLNGSVCYRIPSVIKTSKPFPRPLYLRENPTVPRDPLDPV